RDQSMAGRRVRRHLRAPPRHRLSARDIRGRAHLDVMIPAPPLAARKARNLLTPRKPKEVRGQTQLFVRKAATRARQEKEEGTEGKGQGRAQAWRPWRDRGRSEGRSGSGQSAAERSGDGTDGGLIQVVTRAHRG